MSLLSGLVIDDEVQAADLLKALLEDTRRFSEVRTCYNTIEAANVLAHYSPDLIFLDIRMPIQNGVSFIQNLNQAGPHAEVVFVTAYAEYALEALKHHAFGYLLKPVNRAELIDCIDFFKAHRDPVERGERIELLLQYLTQPERIRISTKNGFYFIEAKKILYMEADGNYTRIELGGKSHLCSMTLSTFQMMLPNPGFIRLGRSLIINKQNILEVEKTRRLVVFATEEQRFTLKLTRSQLRNLDKNLKNATNP